MFEFINIPLIHPLCHFLPHPGLSNPLTIITKSRPKVNYFPPEPPRQIQPPFKTAHLLCCVSKKYAELGVESQAERHGRDRKRNRIWIGVSKGAGKDKNALTHNYRVESYRILCRE
jgi:hypothetical protein